jgi:hypothetical protein
MPLPKDIEVAAVAGIAVGTSGVQLTSTPVDVWGYSVFNGESTVKGASIAPAQNQLFPLGFAAGHSHVPSYGYKVNELWGQVTHTNMTILVYYTPYQQS